MWASFWWDSTQTLPNLLLPGTRVDAINAIGPVKASYSGLIRQ